MTKLELEKAISREIGQIPQEFWEELINFIHSFAKRVQEAKSIDFEGWDDHGLIIDGQPVGRLKFRHSPLHNHKLLHLR